MSICAYEQLCIQLCASRGFGKPTCKSSVCLLMTNPLVHQKKVGGGIKAYGGKDRTVKPPPDVGPDVCPAVWSSVVTISKLGKANPRPGSKSLSFRTQTKNYRPVCLSICRTLSETFMKYICDSLRQR